MLAWLGRWMQAWTEGETENQRLTGVLQIILATFLVLSLAYPLIMAFVSPNPGLTAAFTLTCAAIFGGLWLLVVRGYLRLASVSFLVLLYLVLVVYLALAGGIRTPGYWAFLVLVMLAGLLFSPRAAFIMAFISIFTGAAFLAADLAGLLPVPILRHTQITTWVLFAIVSAACAGLFYLMVAGAQSALRRSRTELLVRQRVEAQLRATQERYQSLLEGSPAIIYTAAFDETSTTLYISPQVQELTGYSPEEWLADPKIWVNSIHPEDRPQALAAIELSHKTLAPLTIEYRLFTRQEKLKWFRDHASAILDDSGNPLHIQGIMVDITDRKAAEQALQVSEQRFREAFDNAPIGMALVDLGEQIIQANPSLHTILGYPPGALIGRTIPSIAHPDDREIELRQAQAVASGVSSHFEIEKRYLTASGGIVWGLLSTSLVNGPRGEPLYYLGQLLDITERKKAEEAINAHARRQAILTELGQTALESGDLQALMDAAVQRVAETLEVPLCKIMQLLQNGQTLLLKAGVGWEPGLVGTATVDASRLSQAGYTLLLQKPVIVANLATETRFYGPNLLFDHNVVSGISVVIQIRGRSFGVLGAHTNKPRLFTQDDANFVQNIANVLAAAVERIQAEDALRRSEEQYRRLAENSPDVIFRVDRERVEYISPSCFGVTGYTPLEYYTNPTLRHDQVHPDDRHLLEQLERTRSPSRIEVRLLHRNGQVVWTEQNLVPIFREDGALLAVEGILRDISERKRAEEALRRSVDDLQTEVIERLRVEAALRASEERYALAAQGANDGLWDIDLATNRAYYSPRWKAILGYSAGEIEEALGDWLSLVHPDDLQQVKLLLAAHLEGTSPHFESEHRIRHRDGAYRWVLSRGLAVQDQYGRTYRMAGSMTDITERKRVEDQLVYDAFHDSLTGLPNRALLSDRLLQAIRYHKRRPDYQFAVIFLDLDRFKVVNDSLGHAVGDRLLVAIAERLAHGLRALDTIARLGGDEFVVLLEDIRDEHEVAQVADRIQEQLSLPFVIDGQELVAAASMGIVLPEPEIERPEEILRDADIAMYRAKASGKARFVFFTAAMREDALSRLALEAQIRRGLERGEFVAYFQPIISLNGDRLIGFEALVRWQHPGRGVLPPVEFLSIAEDSGLVVSIDLCMLSAACRQVAEWTRRGLLPDHFRVNINLSAKQFSRQELVDGIRNQLAMDDLAPGRLALEITEGIIMEDLVHASRVLDELHSMGLEIQIDDFGTGYSSLGYLASLPIDTLKIDKSFVSTIDTETSKAEIVTTIISLAHNLGMDVIAEGVETEQQRQRLITLGCDSAQGFLFSPPLEADLATRWLTRDFPPGHEALHP